MKMYIPEIGDTITLDEDWNFTLHSDYRNKGLASFFGVIPPALVTIPKGDQMKIDRIYIRKGNSDFSSVSFYWNGKRFWAKLDDVNNIEYSSVNPVSTKTQIEILSSIPLREFYHWHPSYTDLSYKINGVNYRDSVFTKEDTQHYTQTLLLGKRPSHTTYNLIWTSNNKPVTREAVKKYILNKHGLLAKDCKFKGL